MFTDRQLRAAQRDLEDPQWYRRSSSAARDYVLGSHHYDAYPIFTGLVVSLFVLFLFPPMGALIGLVLLIRLATHHKAGCAVALAIAAWLPIVIAILL